MSNNSSYEYTEYVSTRWYRSPECLLTKGIYNCKVQYLMVIKFICKDGYMECRMCLF